MTSPQRLPRDLGWLVAGGDRLVGLDGWIGQAPDTGGDVAHLLLHPLGDGNAAQMRAVADVLGLHRGDSPALVDVAPDTTLAHLDDTTVTLRYGDDALLTRPVTGEWDLAARGAGWIILSAGVDGFVMTTTGGTDRLDRYLARPKRIWLGRIRLVTS